MAEIAQNAVNALSQGGLYALMALGLGLLFSVMGLVNLAYGAIVMLGGYTLYYTSDVPWPLMVLCVIAATVIASIAVERLAFRPLRTASPTVLMVSSFAVGIALQQLAEIAFGAFGKGVRPFPGLDKVVEIGDVQIPGLDIVTLITVAVMLAAVTYLLQRTQLGIELRASTEDFAMARLLGVKANRVILMAFAISGVLAGVVALLLIARIGVVSPTVGSSPMLIAFVGAVIGGVGTLTGAAVGGFALGVILSVATATAPGALEPFTQSFAFGLVILILIFRPHGLAGQPASVRE